MLCNSLYKRFDGVYALLNNPVYFAFEECCHHWNGGLFSFETLKQKRLPVSMFDIVGHAEINGELKAHFKDIIREHPQPINYTYKNGILTDRSTPSEFMYYHLITVKKIWRFYIPPYKNDSLFITPLGIMPEHENKIGWYLRPACRCYRGIKKSVKTQRPTNS